MIIIGGWSDNAEGGEMILPDFKIKQWAEMGCF